MFDRLRMPSACLVSAGTLSALAGTALACPLPETAPSQPAYDETTTELLATYPGAVTRDLDEDGAITDKDFHAFAKGLLASVVVTDLDGDGYIGVADEIEAFARVLDKLSGDLTGDDTKSADDALLFIDRYAGGNPDDLAFVNGPTADVNLDGSLTTEDITRFANTAGQQPVVTRCDAAFDVLVWTRGTITFTTYNQGHDFDISSLLPRHQTTQSNLPSWSPPNHTFEISKGWLTHRTVHSSYDIPTRHNSTISVQWPAQHRWDFSSGWEDGEPQHHIQSSRSWPPSHDFEASRTWQGHEGTVSRRWPPSHLEESTMRGHNPTISEWSPPWDEPPYPDPNRWPPTGEHVLSMSATWPASHDPMVSLITWTPNHDGVLSRTWEGHELESSRRWPAAHHQLISLTWLPHESRFRFPPNHDGSLSRARPSQSDPPFNFPPLFPPNHDVFTTVRDIIDVMNPLP